MFLVCIFITLFLLCPFFMLYLQCLESVLWMNISEVSNRFGESLFIYRKWGSPSPALSFQKLPFSSLSSFCRCPKLHLLILWDSVIIVFYLSFFFHISSAADYRDNYSDVAWKILLMTLFEDCVAGVMFLFIYLLVIWVMFCGHRPL